MSLVLVPQDPYQDPRITWHVNSLEKNEDVVVVLGLNSAKPISKKMRATKVVRTTAGWANLPKSGAAFFIDLIFGIHPKYRWIFTITFPLLTLIGTVIFACERLLNKFGLTDTFFFSRYRLVRNLAYLSTITIHFVRISLALYLEGIKNPNKKILANDLAALFAGVALKHKFSGSLHYDTHECWPFVYKDNYFILSKIIGFIEKSLSSSADLVTSVSPQICDYLKKAYNLNNCYLLPNCEPLTLKAPHKSQITTSVVFLFQGGAAPFRGLDKLIETWFEIENKNIHLYLRAPNNRYKEGLIQLAQSLGLLNSTVFFPEAVTEDEMIAAASQADVGIIPYEPISNNHRWACPNKLSQYMAAEIPIISSDMEYVKENILKANCGFSFSDYKYELAHYINALASDASLRKNLGQNGRKYHEEIFNWEQFYRKMPIIK